MHKVPTAENTREVLPLFSIVSYMSLGKLQVNPVTSHSTGLWWKSSHTEHSGAQSCLTLCDPMDCSPPGSSVHGILQAGILKWIAISFSRGSSQPRNWTRVSCTAGRWFTNWTMREAESALADQGVLISTNKTHLKLWVAFSASQSCWWQEVSLEGLPTKLTQFIPYRPYKIDPEW